MFLSKEEFDPSVLKRISTLPTRRSPTNTHFPVRYPDVKRAALRRVVQLCYVSREFAQELPGGGAFPRRVLPLEERNVHVVANGAADEPGLVPMAPRGNSWRITKCIQDQQPARRERP